MESNRALPAECCKRRRISRARPFQNLLRMFPPSSFAARFLLAARENIPPEKKGKIKATTPGLFVVFFFLAVQTRHGVQESGSTVTRFSETIRVQTIPSVTFFFRLAVD